MAHLLTFALPWLPVDVKISNEERSVSVDSKLIGLCELSYQRTGVGEEQLLQTFSFPWKVSKDREPFLILGH